MPLYSRSLFVKPNYSKFTYHSTQRYRPSPKSIEYKSPVCANTSTIEMIETTTRIIGNGIGAYVLVFCSLQWMMYRQIRKKFEDDEDT